MIIKRTRAKRKLIKYPLLLELTSKFQDGVPVAKLIRQYELDISTPCLMKLLKIQTKLVSSISLRRHSLNPPWLDDSDAAPNVQVNPDDWYYEGRFPDGQWKQKLAEN